MPAKVSNIERQPSIGKKIWSLGEFIADESIKSPEALLAPWLCKGDLWLVYSGPGIGKTFFSLNVAYAVASGGDFLCWEANQPKKVLYIDGEMSAWDMQQRLRGIVSAAKRDGKGEVDRALENFRGYAATFQDVGTPFPDFSEEEGRMTLLEMARGMDLVVIDNLTTTMRYSDPDKAMDWTPMQDTLVELRKQDIAVLIVHHTNKSGDQTGTKAKEAILNGMMKLERPLDYSPVDGASFFIHWMKNRGLSGADIAPIRANLQEDRGGLPKWKHKILYQTRVHELMMLARSGNYATQAELASAMDVSTGRISQLKSEAINDHQLFTARQFSNWLKAGRELQDGDFANADY